MRRSHFLLLAAVAILGGLSILGARGRNIAPDAVSRASTWNQHEGEVAWLTDGTALPGEASAFIWPRKGMLVFEWGQELPLDRVRVRIGAADSDFEVRTYVGGRRLEDGSTRDPLGERTATVRDVSRASDVWLVFDLPAGIRADNLELRTQGPAELYEIEILSEGDATAVEELTWAHVKAHRPPGIPVGVPVSEAK